MLRFVLRDLGSAPPLDVSDLSGGSSQSFLVDLEDGQKLVLKTYGDGGHLAPRKEAYASGLLSGLDVPVTRYLTIDESRTRLPFRFAITNYLPGVTVGSLADEPEVTGLYRAMGALLRRLHSVSMPAFGRFGEDGVAERFESNA